METPITIDRALDAFLAGQRARLAPRTYQNYEQVVELLRRSLNGYGYEALSELEVKRLKRAWDAGDEDAFCKLFGPEKIVEELGSFLDYFMIHKVMAGEELLRASGTVAKKLAAWLYEQDYISDEERAAAHELGAAAVRDLPRAERLGQLLYEEMRKTPWCDSNDVPDEDWVEDFLEVERVESGAIWFEGGIGPLLVSKKTSDLAQVGWSVNIVLARWRGSWRIVELGSIYPS
jgi:hypothetical protein